LLAPVNVNAVLGKALVTPTIISPAVIVVPPL
jgi:hypothetical protein